MESSVLVTGSEFRNTAFQREYILMEFQIAKNIIIPSGKYQR